tara:strand:- start:2754 stop:3359 length:606 start_codon:yes stop_codon:yes gene_type:complete
MPGPFWTAQGANTPEPKRQFRFRVIIPKLSAGGLWYATKATKPSFSVTESTHKFLNHTFYYPGKVEWSKVTIGFVDPTNPDATGDILQALRASGYNIPASIESSADLTTIGKAKSVSALETVTIEALNDEGEPVEQWQLNNAWISGITFNDYDYAADELATIDLELRYDWAAFINAGLAGAQASAEDGGEKRLFTLGSPSA